MKLLIGSIMAIALVVIGIYVSKTERKNHELVPAVRRILVAGFAIVFFYILALLSSIEKVSLFGYSAYYASMLWLFYFLLYFSLEYTGSSFEQYVRKKLMIGLLLVATLSILLNNVFGHLFTVEEVTWFTDEIFFEPVLEPLYFVHYAVTALLAIMCLVSLIWRFFTAPAFYRVKYMVIALIMLVLVGLNVHGLHYTVDFSIIGYVAEVICIYYCAFVYTPQRLMQKTLSLVTQDMTMGLVVIDLDGKKIYSNKKADEFLDETNPFVDLEGKRLERWCRESAMSNTMRREFEKSFYQGDTEYILKIQRQRLQDNKEQRQGCYFLIEDRTEEIRTLKLKQHQATHDRLTDLYNKEFFFEQTEQYIKDHPEERLLLVCTDIKDFKMINDFFGTETGDRVLKNFARKLDRQERSFVVYGRLSDDIFAILMKKENFSKRLFDFSVQEAFAGAVESVTFPLVTYVGIYEVVERNLRATVMCDRAKMAITTIKGNRQDRIAYYDNELRENILHEQEIISDFKNAIAENQLKMWLHPQTDANGKMIGAEALVRWVHPKKGRIMPDSFIPVFERNGLIVDVDRFIWECACKQLKQWQTEGKDDVYISVNLSAKDFYYLNIYKVFTELVQEYDISPKKLKLEITETAVMMDFTRQLELINRLRAYGFVVEMDDFGSGYSSLNMLKDIHVDVLKLDMAFLRKNQDTDRGKMILRMIIALSKQLGIQVLSEGVETLEQAEFLREMGCDMFQGYYFAKPMEVQDFEKIYFG
ncbi:MAG: EAL domain-containing protein [Lachnospiraceae bacterium]|nr:EAL domain-containing protein [Lachnospiraceae bacterium]